MHSRFGLPSEIASFSHSEGCLGLLCEELLRRKPKQEVWGILSNCTTAFVSSCSKLVGKQNEG